MRTRQGAVVARVCFLEIRRQVLGCRTRDTEPESRSQAAFVWVIGEVGFLELLTGTPLVYLAVRLDVEVRLVVTVYLAT
jgi:hypothetical protein